MKNKLDIVKSWVLKADNDLRVATNTLETMEDPPLDTVCFHTQQCVEKYLKAYLIFHNIDFPFTHELGDLTILCSTVDEEFNKLIDKVSILIPYAVEIRYPDEDLSVSKEEAVLAVEIAKEVKDFILKKIPSSIF